MKKKYTLRITSVLALMLATLLVYAQPDVDKTIIFVGADDGTPRAEDQVAIDSVSQWVNVVYMGSGEFNDASADDLYAEAGHNAKGILISESIGSGSVFNFALRDQYPVPAIAMEAAIFTDDPATEDNWPLLVEGGGIWGYASPEAVDVQWRIADDMHYITENYNIGDVISYSESADRGVPYLHGIAVDHYILATAARTDGGDVAEFVQDQAIAMAYILDPKILFMNVAYTYFDGGTVDFYNILHRSVKYMFDAHPVGVDKILTEQFDLSVYPNPASGNAALRFSADAGRNVSVELYSLTGGLVGNVYQGKTAGGENVIQLNAEDYASGLYLVKLQIDNMVSYAKFVLQ